MVCSWKPDCGREPRSLGEDDPAAPGPQGDQGILESNPAELAHYQLLPSDMQQGIDSLTAHATDSSDSEEESDSDSSVGSGPSQHPETSIAPTSTSPTPQHKLEGWEKSDIRVDSDEIRSIMSGFSLPPSSVPEWASSVPESSFTSFVWTKIKRNN